MRKILLFASAAMLAASLPSLADAQGNGRGGGRGGGGHGGGHQAQGHGNGGGHEARGERGGGRGHGGGHEARRQERGGGGHERRAERRQERMEHRQERRAERHQERIEHRQERRAERRQEQRFDRQERRAERRQERHFGRQERRAERQDRRIERQALRPERRMRQEERRLQREARDIRREDRREQRDAGVGDRFDHRPQPAFVDRGYTDRFAYWRERRPLPIATYREGCPPGLARQNAFCLPPGQLRRAQLIGQQVPFAAQNYNVPDRYRYRFEDNERYYYRYGDDGYVYELDRGNNLVSSVVPLYATQLLVGEPMPLGYEVYNVPLQYRDQFQDNGEDLYRYDDNAIYRVDGESGIVEAIVALLTGGGSGGLGGLGGGLGSVVGGLGGGLGGAGGGLLGGLGSLGVGQMLPDGYDAYNVPMEYRDEYPDSDEHLYRYADNNIYQVDPQTQLIEQVISLIS